MKKGIITGIVIGGMVTGGIYLYDKFKDSGIMDNIKDSFEKFYVKKATQKKYFTKLALFQKLENEFRNVDREFDENCANMIEMHEKLNEIKKDINEIKDVLNKREEK